ncbi:MAG: hypothetical protein KDN05_06280 [Verrucomicrobiae bacterium]|nr:hypothetical protein [Verrucomicrobiae bacterium]
MPDPRHTTEKDLEQLAKDFGKPMPEHLKERILKEVRRKDREKELTDHFEQQAPDTSDSPEMDP